MQYMSEAKVPADDPKRQLVIANADDTDMPHIGLTGDTYTVLLSGKDTAGRYCLIDMHIPPGGGPPPHRHNFEETFVVTAGKIHAMFRGKEQVVQAGETIHIPSNAPHQFLNRSNSPARMLCICAPAGQEDFFMKLGILVNSRTTPPPKLDETGQRDLFRKVLELAPAYWTELVQKP
jgi:quercetin dioxygenase-like cupin family protein